MITYSEPFKAYYYPIALVGGEFFGNSYKYRPVASYSRANSVQIKFMKVDGTFAYLSDIEVDTFFSVIAMCKLQ